MFRFLRNTVLGLPGSDLHFLKYSSLVKFISTDSTTQSSFAFSYLINTCGLSQERATSALKNPKIHFQTSKNPDYVLAYLKNNGFSKAHISKIIEKFPILLVCSVPKTLEPKFDFFKSQGILGFQLPEIVRKYPYILTTSLEKKIIPNFGTLKSIVQADAKLLALIKRAPMVLTKDFQENLAPNVAFLQAQGVPDNNIASFLVSQPFLFLKKCISFCEIVEEVKKMKFETSQYVFLEAVHILNLMNRASLEAKLDLYREWGLSENEVQSMFRKCPQCVMIPEKNITSNMNYFVREMDYTPSLILENPTVLKHSLTQRIIPRCSVIEILKTKGLLGKHTLSSLITMSEDDFMVKFVSKFEKEVPEVLTAYKGKGG